MSISYPVVCFFFIFQISEALLTMMFIALLSLMITAEKSVKLSAFLVISNGIGGLLAPLKAGKIDKGCRGADVLRLISGGVPVMHLEVERDRYFWYHHTHADTIDKLVAAR